MHDDGPQVILPVPEAPEKIAERLGEAEAILTELGFAGAQVEHQGQTLLIRIAPAEFCRLRDGDFREGMADRLKSLGYVFVAMELTPDDGVTRASGGTP